MFASCTIWNPSSTEVIERHSVSFLSCVCVTHRSLSLLHRLEELDLGNNELYSLVSRLSVWVRGDLFTAKQAKREEKKNNTFPVSVFPYCLSASASPENSFHLLSHRWAEDHLLWTLVLSSNLARAVKVSTIYWQIRRSGCQEMTLYGFILNFFFCCSNAQFVFMTFLKNSIWHLRKLQLLWRSWVKLYRRQTTIIG